MAIRKMYYNCISNLLYFEQIQKQHLNTGGKLSTLPAFVSCKNIAIIRRRNKTTRIIIATNAKLPMTAPATQDDPAPSIVKSALSVVALKIQKKNLSKNFCNDICVPPFYSLFTPMVKCSSKYTLFLTLCQDTWDLHSSICRQCLHPNKQGLRIKEFYDLALFPNCVKFKTFL